MPSKLSDPTDREALCLQKLLLPGSHIRKFNGTWYCCVPGERMRKVAEGTCFALLDAGWIIEKKHPFYGSVYGITPKGRRAWDRKKLSPRSKKR